MTSATSFKTYLEAKMSERSLTKKEKAKKDEIFKALDKKEFVKRYGKKGAEAAMHGVATKGAKSTKGGKSKKDKGKSRIQAESLNKGNEARRLKVPAPAVKETPIITPTPEPAMTQAPQPQPIPQLAPGSPFAFAEAPDAFAGIVESIDHKNNTAAVRFRSALFESSVARSLAITAIKPLAVRSILAGMKPANVNEDASGFAKGARVAPIDESSQNVLLGRVWESNSDVTKVVLEFDLAKAAGEPVAEFPTANLREMPAATTTEDESNIDEAGASQDHLVVFRITDTPGEHYGRMNERLGSALFQAADEIKADLEDNHGMKFVGDSFQVAFDDYGFRMYVGMRGAPAEVAAQADKAVKVMQEVQVPDLTNGNPDATASWEWSSNDTYWNHIFKGAAEGAEHLNPFDVAASAPAQNASGAWNCVHETKGEVTVNEAESAYEAATRAAEHWGLKSAAGIEVSRNKAEPVAEIASADTVTDHYVVWDGSLAQYEDIKGVLASGRDADYRVSVSQLNDELAVVGEMKFQVGDKVNLTNPMQRITD